MNPKLPITSAAFLLLPVFLSAQLSWNRVGGTTRDVAFASDSIVIAVGDGGKVLRSTDAGRTWRQPVVPTSEHLLAVDFVMEGPGMAVGEKGRVLTTSDGGHQWRKAPVPFSVELRDIDVVSPRLAFAVGDQGTILSSTDGGLRWDLLQSGISLTLTGVHFVDPKHGLVVGANGTMLRTTDGGDSWTSVLIPTSYYLSGVEFLDSMRGVAFGIQGTILHTSDGGATWTDISLVSSRAISAAIYTDTATIAVVSGSLILRSTDQGRTWNEHDVRDSLEQPLRDFEGQIDPLRPELHGIAGSQRNAVAVGSDGLIFSSDDAVRTWSTRSFIPLSGLTRNFYIAGFQILDSLNWVGTSWPGKFYRTTDAGATWTFKQVSQYQEYFEAIHFTSRDSGIILTDGGVLGTDNGGRSWRSLVSGISGSTTRELAFIEGYTSYIVDKEAVRRTADGGWSWDSLYAVPGRSIPLSILFLDQEQGLLIYNDYDDSLDYHGTTVVRTDDSGESWSTVLFPSPMSNARLHAGISDDVWITGNILQGGSTARMLRSTDAGRSWDSVDLTFGTSGISDISFANDTMGYAVGGNGLLLKSSDGGSTWMKVPFDSTLLLSTIYFTSQDETIITASGFLIRGSVIDEQPAAARQPELADDAAYTYLHLRVVPNPVVSQATVRINGLYSVRGQRLRLQLYDLMGNEIADLSERIVVDASGTAGSVTVSSQDVPSGNYLLKLSAGESAITCRILFVRQ